MQIDRRSALGLVGVAACAPAMAMPTGTTATARFLHGVASGDPLHDRVILWTRVTVDADQAAVEVTWEIARDAAFRQVVRRGTEVTTAARDFTVKIDATGLRPRTRYFYRFHSGAATSSVGRTQTLPKGPVDRMTIAVASCSLYSCGFFNGYREIAGLEVLDLVLHLGDYIYEYGGAPDQLGMTIGAKIGRVPQPLHEAVTLEDYRARHAYYRLDQDLQDAHARAPWICVWDDHETANDSWTGGAQNHDASEGDWIARRNAAVRAYYEWIPIRQREDGRPLEEINRTFELGDLATLIMVENRFLGRSRQLDLRDTADVTWQVIDTSAPGHPTVVTDPAVVRAVLGAVAHGQPAPAPYDVRVDAEALRKRLADPSRSVFGPAQEAWLRDQIAGSVRAGKPWQLIGNQVVMARTTGADVLGLLGHERWQRVLAAAAAKLRPWLRQLAVLPPDIPFGFDGWDAYPAARSRMDEILAQPGAHPLVLSGDSHVFWVNELSGAGRQRIAAEIGTTAITSSSLGNMLGDTELGSAYEQGCPEVLFCNHLTKGFALVTLRPDEAHVALIGLSTVLSRDYQAGVLKSCRIRPGAGGGVAPLELV